MRCLLALCRPGFEKECVAALADACSRRGIEGFGRARPETGYALYELTSGDARDLLRLLSLDELIFARDLFATDGPLPMAAPDRLAAMQDAIAALPGVCRVETGSPDTNEGRELTTLARKLIKPLEAALRHARVKITPTQSWRCMLILVDGTSAFLCIGDAASAPVWPLGVPRLRLAREAPSRSALKLEEAWHLFLPRESWPERLGPGRTAVDLGAAPGGWTWQMIRRGMRVEAVDNGPMAQVVRDDVLATHVRADGFTHTPKRAVDWLVCDMVEQPSRVTKLVSGWLTRGWCREAIFNLKLPMKRRYHEAQLNLSELARALEIAELSYEMRARQLYHDREEITVHVRVHGKKGQH